APRGGRRAPHPPPNARPLATLTSRPLAELIGGMNKYSNNFMTRQLFLTLGVEQYGPPATLDKARRAWRATLEGVGVDLRGAVVDNGAGLSRQSRLSANGLLQGLLAAYQSPHRYTFLSSLAQVGVDGTLRRRFRHEPLQGRVYGKTGTLNGVRALAGYVRATSGATLAVAILHEQPGLRRNAAVDVQNTLLRWVYHNH
ncbi:MAG: D-alanyl-D-alanine carboxypeptidase/D-alanyl-D-alanine-endopeptidase, partial [Candidatus Competibacterales bacterium]